MVASTLLALIAFASPAVLPEGSLVAVITHKGGFASGLAHDHLVAATRYTAGLEFDPGRPLETRFTLEFATEDLLADDPDLQRAWYPRIRDVGLLEEPFVALPENKRAKIRRSMLGPKQLDAEKYPRIRAAVVEVRAREAEAGGPFPFEALVALEVRGQRIERPMRARFEVRGGTIVVEAFGTFRFTDFDIKPFSAMLGAVKNLDAFDVYVYLTLGAPS